MGESKKDFIIIIIAVVAITAIATIMFSSVTLHDTATIIVNCEDTNLNGQFTIIEFKDIEKNSNGTYNTSQFGTNEGVWKGKVTNVTVKNGKANYTLNDDTEFFALDSYVYNFNKDYDLDNESAPNIEVKYIYNGEEVLSSNKKAYFDQCDISWGGKLFHRNGVITSDSELNIDLPDLQESRKFIMDLYFNQTE